MLNYQKSDTFIVEDVDHVYHICKVKLEHAIFLLLTMIMPLVINLRGMYAILLIGAELYLCQKLTNAEIKGRPLQYNHNYIKKIKESRALSKLFKFRVTYSREVYRGDL